jgi:hypothetical protein
MCRKIRCDRYCANFFCVAWATKQALYILRTMSSMWTINNHACMVILYVRYINKQQVVFPATCAAAGRRRCLSGVLLPLEYQYLRWWRFAIQLVHLSICTHGCRSLRVTSLHACYASNRGLSGFKPVICPDSWSIVFVAWTLVSSVTNLNRQGHCDVELLYRYTPLPCKPIDLANEIGFAKQHPVVLAAVVVRFSSCRIWHAWLSPLSDVTCSF